jgi:hypothetical protein
VSFSCSGLPLGASCSFSPATVTPSSGPASTMLTVTTTATSASFHRDPNPLLPGSVLAVALCCLSLKKRRRVRLLLMMTSTAVGLSLLNGCGASNSAVTQRQPVTSTVTITATAGSTQHTTIFSLTVN